MQRPLLWQTVRALHEAPALTAAPSISRTFPDDQGGFRDQVRLRIRNDSSAGDRPAEQLADDGKFSGQIGPMITVRDLINRLQRLADGARERDVMAFYARHGADEYSFDASNMCCRASGSASTIRCSGRVLMEEFFPPLQPKEDDIVLAYHRGFDSFFGTDLGDQLTRHGIEELVLAGLTSETCVEETGRHAVEAGYHVMFSKDAVGDFTEQANRAALGVAFPTFGTRA